MEPRESYLDSLICMLAGRRPALGTVLDNNAPLPAIAIHSVPIWNRLPCANVVHDVAPLIIYYICHEASRAVSRRCIVFHNSFDLLLVSLAISLEEVVSIGLRWRFGVWVVEQILDAQ